MRTRRCINARTPETGTNHLGGSFDSLVAKADVPTKLPAEANPNPLLWGGGSYVRYSNQPLAQCKSRSDSFTEISSDAPLKRRFGPLSPEDRARRVAELRTILAAPAFQARLRAGEQGKQP